MTNFEVIIKVMNLIRCGKISRFTPNNIIYNMVCNQDDSDVEDDSLKVL